MYAALEHYTSVFFNMADSVVFVDDTYIFIAEIVFITIAENVVFSLDGVVSYAKSCKYACLHTIIVDEVVSTTAHNSVMGIIKKVIC